MTELHVTALQGAVNAVLCNTGSENLQQQQRNRNENTQQHLPNATQVRESTDSALGGTTTTVATEDRPFYELNPPRISNCFPTLRLMWDEWHGTGSESTLDKPVVGGFQYLEDTYKTKWRKHLDSGQGRHFTRVRLIILGLRKVAESTETPIESVIEHLEREWTKGKKSPDAMVKFLQEQGYLKKTKPRGKHALHA
jgi:hypothetical protein